MSCYWNGTPLQCVCMWYPLYCMPQEKRIYRVCTTHWCSVTYSIVLYILAFTLCCLWEFMTAGEVFCYIPFHCMHAIRSCCFVIWYHIIIASLLHQHCQARECPGMTAMHIAVVPTYIRTNTCAYCVVFEWVCMLWLTYKFITAWAAR